YCVWRLRKSNFWREKFSRGSESVTEETRCSDTADRTTEQLIGHIRDGFYGTADGQWEGITATRCQNAIAHAKGVASALIRAHPRLRGCYPVGTAEADMHIDTFNAACRERYGTIALSRDAAAFANGQDSDYGGDAADPDANYG